MSRELTQEEQDQRKKILDAEHNERPAEPERARLSKWLKNAFAADPEAIWDFSAGLLLEGGATEKENQELTAALNQIRRHAGYLTAEITGLPAPAKVRIAQEVLTFQPDDPASLAFVSGVGVSKHLQAVKGANKLHAEDRAMKAEVFAWLDTNFASIKIMDAAAEAIAGKIAPVKFRTARSWVGEWKKLQSASTP